MIRVALCGIELPARRDLLFEVADASECDYLFTTDRTAAHDPRRTFVLDTGDVLGALFDGATETRSTMSRLDGPVFLVSAPFVFPPAADHFRASGDAASLEAYAELHRRWMVAASFTAMTLKAIEFLAAGELQVVGDVVWIDGVPGPCRMGEAPSFCREAEKSGVPVTCPFIASD